MKPRRDEKTRRSEKLERLEKNLRGEISETQFLMSNLEAARIFVREASDK